MMNHARLNVGLEGVAISEAAYQQAVAYARERIQGRPIGGAERAPIIDHPDVRRMLMDMKARTEAMRALAYYTAACMDRAQHLPTPEARARSQGRVDLLTPVVKGWCTENAVLIASTGIQVHGGMGYVEETGAAQYLRDARITTIYEGTTGIQANDLIGRKLARNRGVNVGELIEDIRTDLTALVLSNDADLLVIHAAAAGALHAFEEATSWMLAHYDESPREAAAGAMPYLKLMGTIVGGWQMARAALIARELLGAGAENAAFLRAKIGTARFFAEHVLPQARAYRDEVIEGAGSTLALEEAAF
jgi:3-(methylsulfanyl)propanoyl-CoA dehydrogenase